MGNGREERKGKERNGWVGEWCGEVCDIIIYILLVFKKDQQWIY